MKNERLWKADNGDGTFKNPILFADYSDPDVIRVGDTYYLTASSFNYTPGLPILTSTDLVNWELKNYAIETIDFERYDTPAHAKGIWAPAIRYHNHKFWICYGMPDEGIFIIQTEDPLGKWSEPVLLLEGAGYIDPCPFWDEDGKAYVIHGYARSRIGFKSIIGMFPIDAQGTKAIGDDIFIYDGTKSQQTIEGPKVYKRSGWYYIFAPAGGVKYGWQTVLRSKNINGPYEERIVMKQGNSDINGPHQGGLVDTLHGDEWFIHFQDLGFYGRITHLQPVKWVDNWPVIGINPVEEGYGEPCRIHKKPIVSQEKPTYLKASDDFSSPKLGLQWQWLGNGSPSFYRLRNCSDEPISVEQSKQFLSEEIEDVKRPLSSIGKFSISASCLEDRQDAFNETFLPSYEVLSATKVWRSHSSCILSENKLRLNCIKPSSKQPSSKQPSSKQPMSDTLSLWNASNVLTQKFVCPLFEAETQVCFDGLKLGEAAGLVVLGGQYHYLAVRKTEKGTHLIYGESVATGTINGEKTKIIRTLDEGFESIILRTVLYQHKDTYRMKFQYRYERNYDALLDANNRDILKGTIVTNNATIVNIEDSFEPSVHTWVGAKLGLFAVSTKDNQEPGYAEFNYFKVEAKDE